MRDNSANAMARVNAARALSLMENEMDEPNYTDRAAPRQAAGITIVIEAPGASAKVLNPAPVIEHEASPHTWPSVD